MAQSRKEARKTTISVSSRPAFPTGDSHWSSQLAMWKSASLGTNWAENGSGVDGKWKITNTPLKSFWEIKQKINSNIIK